ncbi:hypothetical protein RNJ44_02828 [Nakaseomyces bracarensis]|uniref:BZIP domain-containing protein n=1 Tax=Nakaseomyces bracarensis TaxID=273131 RepID=A0ABR4P0R4_9SACH
MNSDKIEPGSDVTYVSAVEEQNSSFYQTPNKYNNGGNTIPSSIPRFSEGRSNVVTDIINSRRISSAQDMSPTRHRLENRKQNEQNKLKEIRKAQRLQKAMEKRGGLEHMQNFIMYCENNDYLSRLIKEAEENQIPLDVLEQIEVKQNEADLDDEDILDYFDKIDQYEQELNLLLEKDESTT